MSPPAPPGPPPDPPLDFPERALKFSQVDPDVLLSRIHRSHLSPLHFGSTLDPEGRQRWDAPDAAYGVCYMARAGHIAFAETLLRDLILDVVHEGELAIRSLTLLRVLSPLRLVTMHGRALRAHGADASVVHGPYTTTWAWSAAIHDHPGAPDGIYYRARHDDSGYSVALFQRAGHKVEPAGSTRLLDPAFAPTLARWLDGYEVGLTS